MGEGHLQGGETPGGAPPWDVNLSADAEGTVLTLQRSRRGSEMQTLFLNMITRIGCNVLIP